MRVIKYKHLFKKFSSHSKKRFVKYDNYMEMRPLKPRKSLGRKVKEPIKLRGKFSITRELLDDADSMNFI